MSPQCNLCGDAVASGWLREKPMLEQCLAAVLLCGVAVDALAANVTLRGTAGNLVGRAHRSANGAINALEV